eukprot:1161361-Pelagomonas_calceolata.AAC.15
MRKHFAPLTTSFKRASMHACCKLLTTLRYASLKPVYFPASAAAKGKAKPVFTKSRPGNAGPVLTEEGQGMHSLLSQKQASNRKACRYKNRAGNAKPVVTTTGQEMQSLYMHKQVANMEWLQGKAEAVLVGALRQQSLWEPCSFAGPPFMQMSTRTSTSG